MGTGLSALTSYLVFGNNKDQSIMSMTAPFIMEGSYMRVALPVAQKDNPPQPVENSMLSLEHVQEEKVATLAFPGICTDAEIERRKKELLEAIEKDGHYSVVSDNVKVLQYNAPGTLPWRRVNEVAVQVAEPLMPLNMTKEVIQVEEVEEENDQPDTEEEGIQESTGLEESETSDDSESGTTTDDEMQ
eukprot:CAMPEP_0118677810 /NCGR_PEP_ID=MMETSP0800-20121206/2845_1 /TAXON_ID=210618 ORGANISM="Striatella unipunctata, Strain CCMP2910" /NCGR_SAMPLE_ID=MMETSP0800 /ASSEMBLY_ACC=CAM_ASM_000638 /LENGTH=187 /DNA_ID=CAMNT_0006573547 /DNA_START=99 /DNA_END=662 /DNA_ORIENTATION=-